MKAASSYKALVDEISRRGFCGGVVNGQPSHIDMFIPDSGAVTVDQFVDWVFKAEGLDPPYPQGDSRRFLRDAFVRHMGGTVVDAQALSWRGD